MSALRLVSTSGLLAYHDGMNRNSRSSLRRVRVKPEIGSEFLRRLNQRKPEKFAYKVDYVSLYLTAKAVESCIDLQRRDMVIVKGTERHAVALNIQTVVFSRLAGRNLRFDELKDVQDIPPNKWRSADCSAQFQTGDLVWRGVVFSFLGRLHECVHGLHPRKGS